MSCQQSQWETHGPNVARLIGEFKDSSKPTNTDDEPENHLHHEDSQACRNEFSKDISTLCKSMSVNPFTQDKLVTINSSQPIPDVAVAILKKFEGVGESLLTLFDTELKYPFVKPSKQ